MSLRAQCRDTYVLLTISMQYHFNSSICRRPTYKNYKLNNCRNLCGTSHLHAIAKSVVHPSSRKVSHPNEKKLS